MKKKFFRSLDPIPSGFVKNLEKVLDHVFLPKKDRSSAKYKEIEHSEEFVKSRRKYSGVESTINALENHGLDRCLDHGLHGFKRDVSFFDLIAKTMTFRSDTS